jgi:hypothetical protein
MPGGNVAPRPSKPTPTPTPTKSTGRGNPQVAAKSNDSNKVQMLKRSQEMKKENAKKTITTNKQGAKTGNTSTASVPFTVTIPLPDSPGDGPSTNESSYDFTPKSIKIPDRDAIITLEREGADQALITAVLFEQIGATELVKFIRNDTIDGIDPAYSVISNVADLKTKLDVSYLIAKQRSDTTIDNGFSIRLQDKLPSIDYLFENNIPNYVYFDTTVNSEGSLVIELDNIDIDEIIEVEIDTNGTIVEVRS